MRPFLFCVWLGGGWFVVRGPLADADDDELGGADGCDADEADEASVIEVALGHGGAVALNEECFFGLGAHEGSALPLVVEEVGDGVADIGPELFAVGFEDGPLGALLDGVLEVVEVAADVDVLEVGVAGDGASSPDEDAAVGEDPEGVDAGAVEGGGVGFGEVGFERGGAEDGEIGRGLGDAVLGVRAGEDSGEEAGGRGFDSRGACGRREGIGDVEPGVVEGGGGGVEFRADGLDVGDGGGGRGIEEGEAVGSLDVGDEGRMDGSDGGWAFGRGDGGSGGGYGGDFVDG